MLTKTQIKISLDSLPENVTIEEIIEHLIFFEKVNKRLDDSANGRINTVEETRLKLNKWIRTKHW